MTQVQCECGKFKAEIDNLPQNSAGRCICYCDDCQTYLHFIGREKWLDGNGGSEIVPVYPKDFKIVYGEQYLSCVRLSPRGLLRWYTSCCKTPIGNNIPGFPWLGTLAQVYNTKDSGFLQRLMGPIRSRIFGNFAKGTPPEGTSGKPGLKDLGVILPFLLKGFLGGKSKGSPFYGQDGKTPVVAPTILTLEERNQIRERIGFKKI